MKVILTVCKSRQFFHNFLFLWKPGRPFMRKIGLLFLWKAAAGRRKIKIAVTPGNSLPTSILVALPRLGVMPISSLPPRLQQALFIFALPYPTSFRGRQLWRLGRRPSSAPASFVRGEWAPPPTHCYLPCYCTRRVRRLG